VAAINRRAHLVEKLVSTERYQNASEVLRDGLRLIEDREAQEGAPDSTRSAKPPAVVWPTSTPAAFAASSRRLRSADI